MMTPLPIFAYLSDHPTLWESVNFILEGFLFVLVVLALLGLVTTVIGFIFKRYEAASKPAPVKTVKPEVAAPAPTPVTEEETVLPAIVAAAVFSVMGDKPHRILNIRPADETWAREGRRSILGSHKVR